MSKKNLGSVAPKERINIKYTPNTGGAQAEVELPLNMLIVGDMKGKTEETPLKIAKRFQSIKTTSILLWKVLALI